VTSTDAAHGFQLNNFNQQIGSLSGAGNVLLGSGTVTVHGSALSTFTGLVSGANGQLVVSGGNTLNLTRAAGNTYTGGTTISGGTLLANNTSGSATGTGSVTVGIGGVLGGSGRIEGALIINGGTLAPGNSPGLITIDDNVTFNAGNFAVEIAGLGAGVGYDQLLVTGTTNNITLNSANLVLTLISGFNAPIGTQLTIINNQTNNSIGGTLFDGAGEGGTVYATLGSKTLELSVSYIGGTGNDVVLTTLNLVPEPASAVMLALGGMMLLRRKGNC
jgi:autotransporter-associated beta strand protein